MKKLINDVEDVLAESLDGFAAAHADLVVLGAERKFVRRAKLAPGQGRADFRRRSGPRAAACRIRRLRHAGRRLSRPGVHLAHARSDAAAAEAVETGAGVPVHRQELRGRLMNFEMAAEMAKRHGRDACSPTTMSRSRHRPSRPDAAVSQARWSSRRSSARPPSRARTSWH